MGKERHHAIVGSEAVTRNRPAGEGGEAAGVRNFFESFERKSAAVGGSNQRTHAGTRDEANWNSLFLKNFEDSDVGHAACKTAAQSHADCGESRLDRNTFAGQSPPESLHGPDDLAKTVHRKPPLPGPPETLTDHP